MAQSVKNIIKGVMSYNELAMEYMPNTPTPERATRILTAMISKNDKLQQHLAKTGFCKRARYLTPRQVRLIMRYLGEPLNLSLDCDDFENEPV